MRLWTLSMNSQNIGVRAVAVTSGSFSSKTRLGALNVSVTGSKTKTQISVCLWAAFALYTRGTWQKWLRPFIEDPQPILALLETLKDDPGCAASENTSLRILRDIIKDYPEVGYAVLERWGSGR